MQYIGVSGTGKQKSDKKEAFAEKAHAMESFLGKNTNLGTQNY